MILLLGAGGYLGQAFAGELRRRGASFIPLTRNALDYTQFDLLFDYVRKMGPEFVINAVGYPGRPNVDGCEQAREMTLHQNTLLPQTIARVCLVTNTPWGHVSSACVYCGAKVMTGGETRIERDLNRPEIRRLLAQHPDRVRGFTELDEPNFSFRCAPCSFYSGTKVLAEEAIKGEGRSYIWRPGMMFHEREEPRNLLCRLQRYPKIYDSVNCLSHRDEFVRACLDLWQRRAPYGIYNMINPGAVTNRQIVVMIERILKPSRRWEFWGSDEEFYRVAAKSPRSNAILDGSKLLAAGIRLRPVMESLEYCLRHWRPALDPADHPGSPAFAAATGTH